MPRVTTYGDRKVATEALPGVRKQAAETFASEGGLAAEAMQGFGTNLARIGMTAYSEIQRAERERADDIQNLRTLQAFDALDHQLLHAPDTGILHKKGQAVMEGRDGTLESFDEQAGMIGNNLKSDNQRLFYERLKVERRTSMRNRIDDYGSSELDRVEQTEFQATLESSANRAIHNVLLPGGGLMPHGEAIVAGQLQTIDALIARHGVRVGMGAEAQAELAAKTRSAVHVGIIENLVAAGRDQDAKAYFEEVENKDTHQIDAEQLARVRSLVEEGSVLGQGQRAADQILQTTKSLPEAREAAKKLDKPKVRQEAEQRIEHEYGVREKIARDEHEAMTQRGLNLAVQGGTIRAIPPHEWRDYKVGERESIENYLEQKAKGITTKTDENTDYFLNDLARSEDPKKRELFSNISLMKMRHLLSTSDFEKFQKLQEGMRKDALDQGAEAHKRLVHESARDKIVDEALRGMRLDPTPVEPGSKNYNEENTRRVGAFRRAVREAISRLEADPNRKFPQATDEEVQSIVDQLRTPTGERVTKKGYIWDSTAQAYAFETAQAQAAAVQDIPVAERRRIEEALRETGKPITDQAILRWFNTRLRKTRKDQ
jgi:hypothetical protein